MHQHECVVAWIRWGGTRLGKTRPIFQEHLGFRSCRGIGRLEKGDWGRVSSEMQQVRKSRWRTEDYKLALHPEVQALKRSY